MINQDQYSEQVSENHNPDKAEFSASRRVATAVLVLVAALLLGYVIYAYTIQITPEPARDPVVAPAEQGLSAEQQAILRLQALEKEVALLPTGEQIEQLKSFQQEETVPSQEQLTRLETFGDES